MRLSEAIEQFRKLEDIESVLILTGKDDHSVNLRRVALAWSKIPLLATAQDDFKDTPDLWETLWGGVKPNYPALDRITGVTTERYVRILKGYRLIFPDGSLGVTAQKALRQLAKAELGL